MEARQIIIRPVITERSFDMQEYNRFTFEVAKTASKIEIAKAVEEIFDVKVLKVNTVNVKSKKQRTAQHRGQDSHLEEGHRNAGRGRHHRAVRQRQGRSNGSKSPIVQWGIRCRREFPIRRCPAAW